MNKLTPSSVLGDECKALADELLRQPELLAGVFLDSDPVMRESETIVPAVKQYTGARSAGDDARLLTVGALRLLGASDREIEKACGVTRRSIPLLMAALEKSGRVTPLKERLTSLVGDNAERSSLLLRKLMERGMDGACDLDLAAMIKAVGAVNSFQVEKFQLLTGQATERIETVVAAGREEFERWWKETAVPVESKTTGTHDIVEVSSQSDPVNTPLNAPDPSKRMETGGGDGPAPDPKNSSTD